MYFDGTFFCVIVIPSVSNSDAIIFFSNFPLGQVEKTKTSFPVHQRWPKRVGLFQDTNVMGNFFLCAGTTRRPISLTISMYRSKK